MAYVQFDKAAPSTTQTRQAAITSILNNLLAIRDIALMGDAPNFAYSITTGTGTASQPQYVFRKNSTDWLRTTLTWGVGGTIDGCVTTAVHDWSSNSGGLYDTIRTEVYSYDADSNVTSTTWS